MNTQTFIDILNIASFPAVAFFAAKAHKSNKILSDSVRLVEDLTSSNVMQPGNTGSSNDTPNQTDLNK